MTALAPARARLIGVDEGTLKTWVELGITRYDDPKAAGFELIDTDADRLTFGQADRRGDDYGYVSPGPIVTAEDGFDPRHP